MSTRRWSRVGRDCGRPSCLNERVRFLFVGGVRDQLNRNAVQCPKLAQSGHRTHADECPLLGKSGNQRTAIRRPLP
jgi:hypothetical protein